MVLTQSQVFDVQEIIDRSIKSLLADKQFLAGISTVVAKTIEESMQPTFNAINAKLNEIEDDTKIIKGRYANLIEENAALKIKLDSIEQYSRRSNIRIMGLPEEPKEDIHELVKNFLKQKLSIDPEPGAIDRTHRIGVVRTGSSRQVIVKFVSYQHKRMAIQRRKLLKGTGISISEDLTKERLSLFKSAQSRYGKGNVWTLDGLVWVNHNKKRFVIKCTTELE